MPERRNLFAYTEPTPTNGYPGYASLNQEPDGRVTLTVRSAGNGGRDLGCVHLPAEVLRGLVSALAVPVVVTD